MKKSLKLLCFVAYLSGCGIDPNQLNQDHEEESNAASRFVEKLPPEVEEELKRTDKPYVPVEEKESLSLGAARATSAASGEWHSLFLTGDNSIWAFDNARITLSSMFSNVGFSEDRMKHLTMMSSLINQGMTRTSHATIQSSLRSFNLGPSDLCLIHMTSHGSRTGFYLVGQRQLTPSELDQMLQETCGSRPTVVLVSACYSGIFSDHANMRRPNRIILTAARSDRTSFGCGSENQYTYWDGCLIDNLRSSHSWTNLHNNILACIERKEAQGNFLRSYPQFYMGPNASNIPYPFQ